MEHVRPEFLALNLLAIALVLRAGAAVMRDIVPCRGSRNASGGCTRT